MSTAQPPLLWVEPSALLSDLRPPRSPPLPPSLHPPPSTATARHSPPLQRRRSSCQRLLPRLLPSWPVIACTRTPSQPSTPRLRSTSLAHHLTSVGEPNRDVTTNPISPVVSSALPLSSLLSISLSVCVSVVCQVGVDDDWWVVGAAASLASQLRRGCGGCGWLGCVPLRLLRCARVVHRLRYAVRVVLVAGPEEAVDQAGGEGEEAERAELQQRTRTEANVRPVNDHHHTHAPHRTPLVSAVQLDVYRRNSRSAHSSGEAQSLSLPLSLSLALSSCDGA